MLFLVFFIMISLVIPTLKPLYMMLILTLRPLHLMLFIPILRSLHLMLLMTICKFFVNEPSLKSHFLDIDEKEMDNVNKGVTKQIYVFNFGQGMHLMNGEYFVVLILKSP